MNCSKYRIIKKDDLFYVQFRSILGFWRYHTDGDGLAVSWKWSTSNIEEARERVQEFIKADKRTSKNFYIVEEFYI